MHKRISTIAASAAFVVSLTSSGQAQSTGTSAFGAAVDRVRANPGNAEASFQLAAIAINDGNVPTAISALERLLMVNPRLDNIRFELGLLYLRSGATELAESYISRAMQSPDIPAEVRQRGDELLSEARGANQTTTFTATARAAWRFDSNATSAPDAGIFTTPLGDVELDAENAGVADMSATFGASARLSHDLGFQAGHLLVFEAGYSGARFHEQTQLDLDRVDVAAGPTIMLGRSLGRPADLSVRAFGGYQLRAGEAYLGEYGLRAALGLSMSPETQLSLAGGVAYQDYFATGDLPANDGKDGFYANGTLGAQHRYDENTLLRGSLTAARKDAEVDFEAFSLLRGSVGVVRALPEIGGVAPVLSLDATFETRSYDGASMMATTASDRNDSAYEFSLGLEYPLRSGPAVLTQVSYRNNNSNDDLNDYDNIGVQIGIAHRF